jgi:hypothetical protein
MLVISESQFLKRLGRCTNYSTSPKELQAVNFDGSGEQSALSHSPQRGC